MASAFPTEVDEKLVEAFTTSVYEFLELFTPPTGTLHATIAAGKDALPKVRKIIDAMQQKMNKSQEKGRKSQILSLSVAKSERFHFLILIPIYVLTFT